MTENIVPHPHQGGEASQRRPKGAAGQRAEVRVSEGLRRKVQEAGLLPPMMEEAETLLLML